MIQIVLFWGIAFAASVAGAISGIGGGIIIKPLLDVSSQLSVSGINFLSGTTVLTMSLIFLLRSRGSGVKLENKRGSVLGMGAVLGGLLGKKLFSLGLTHFLSPSSMGRYNQLFCSVCALVCSVMS